MNFLLAFDRLQLYYFHRHNLSFYATLLLSSANALEFQEGSLVQNFFQSCEADSVVCRSVNGLYNSLLAAVEHKAAYSDAEFLGRNENGVGFFANMLDYFFYELPSSLLMCLVLTLLFRLLFHHRFSLYLRQYSLVGVFLIIVCEGNVEQFSFYFFMECRNFFSASLSHRLANVFLVFFFFVVVTFAVGGLVWFRYHYKKLVKYLVDDYRCLSLYLLCLETLEKSTYPLLFGAVHALLRDTLALQSVVLAVVEVSYFAVKLLCLRSLGVLFKFRVCVLAATSLLRMGFIATLYLYSSEGEPATINDVHFYLVWLYIICWLLETAHDICIFVVDLFRFLRKGGTLD